MFKLKLSLILLFPTLVLAAPAPEVGFSRGSPTAKSIVLKAIDNSKSSLYIAAYQFTNPDIVKAVIAAKKRNVTVAVVLDRTQGTGDTQAALVASGISCKVDHTYKIMHHKFMVIDGKSVETGSFNYTVNADKGNAENAILIPGVPVLAAKYKAQWDKVNATASPCPGG